MLNETEVHFTHEANRTTLLNKKILKICSVASLVAQSIKNLPAMRETWVRPLGWEDPLEEGMGTHSSILAWRIPWTEEPGGLQLGLQSVRHDLLTKQQQEIITGTSMVVQCLRL